MFHQLAFTRSQAVTAAITPLTAVTDVYATVSSNGNYFLPRPLKLAMAYAQGANIGLAQVNTPTLRQISLPFISPVAGAAAIPSLFPLSPNPAFGPWIPEADELGVGTTNGGGGAEQQTAFLWMHDGNVNIGGEPIITVLSQTSITAGNLTWGAGTLSLTQPLPSGRYRVVGMDAVGANLLAARLVFPTQGPKPGVLGRVSNAVLPNPIFRMGRLGSFGEFESYAMPSVELFGSAAPTTQNIFLDLQRIGG